MPPRGGSARSFSFNAASADSSAGGSSPRITRSNSVRFSGESAATRASHFARLDSFTLGLALQTLKIASGISNSGSDQFKSLRICAASASKSLALCPPRCPWSLASPLAMVVRAKIIDGRESERAAVMQEETASKS